jgi:thymidine phosphorylase
LPQLRFKNLGINTHKEAVIYMRSDCPVCRSEGFEAPARIQVRLNGNTVIATLNTIDSPLLSMEEASLSTYAIEVLQAQAGDILHLSHPRPVESLSYIRDKINGEELTKPQLSQIIADVVAGSLSDIQISAFLASSGKGRLSYQEIMSLTQAMIDVGTCLSWPNKTVVDKHCVGGLPGNRTSIILVPIVASFGLTMPKTSSRAITSPAGTADTMEVLAPVDLSLAHMRRVVEQENGCIAWGGSVNLSPADDMFIRIERGLGLDSEGQLVASILSKKISAGSSNIVIDIPVGPTAKIRSIRIANVLKQLLINIGKALNVNINVIITDGSQPVGRGIGPALEAKDVLAVLSNDKNAPRDLRERALILAGMILEFSPHVEAGAGKSLATSILESGNAWKKFQAICQAQGGMFEPPTAAYTQSIEAKYSGIVTDIHNHHLARVAKLAGAPTAKAAGVELLVHLGTHVNAGEPLFIIHAESRGELEYAANYVAQEQPIISIKKEER